MISANKISLVKNELYSLRRLCAFQLKNLDVYGHAWDINTQRRMKILLAETARTLFGGYVPRLKSTKNWFKKLEQWKFAPENKDSVLENYKVSLVIENSQEYLTEKIFDSFFSGCIPVYVGPELDLYGIPSHLAVQVSANVREIEQGISKALEMNYAQWRLDIKNWLQDPATISKWSLEQVYRKLSTELLGMHLDR
jgi:hypothetical protein